MFAEGYSYNNLVFAFMQKIVISKFLPEKVYENNAVLAFELTGPYTP